MVFFSTVKEQAPLSPLTIQVTRPEIPGTANVPYSVRVVDVTNHEGEDYRTIRNKIFNSGAPHHLVAESGNIGTGEVRELQAPSSGQNFLIGVQHEGSPFCTTLVAERYELQHMVVNWFGGDNLAVLDRAVQLEELTAGYGSD